MYQLIRDDQGRFYAGNGQWTADRERAHMFSSFLELMEECGKRGIRKCKVVEVLPRTGEFELTIQAR